jgi:2,3-bisphosphoglycerate-dependent phosphoglycerate mutase
VSTFYLVRHAHANWTPDEQRPLSTRGLEDAIRVADVLHAHPIDLIYSSPYRRARQTIEPLATRLSLPIHEEPDLRERHLAEGEVEDFLQAVEATWRDPSFAHPGGESNTTAQQRGLAVVRRLREQHIAQYIVLATHGNLLALILQGFDPGLDFAFWNSMTMPDIYKLDCTPGGETAIRRLWAETGGEAIVSLL